MVVWEFTTVVAVVSPLDEVTQELKTVKETLDSVQASLITSVSLIQGKYDLPLYSYAYDLQ